MESFITEGIRLFNSQKFFEAHEALEAVWLEAQGEEKTFLHGLIQVAAAFHHFTSGNLTGFRSLLEKGLAKLEGCGEFRGGIELKELLEQLQPWREVAQQSTEQALANGRRETTRSAPEFPHILPAAEHQSSQ
jgi:predicted metal-dependent hydrolase